MRLISNSYKLDIITFINIFKYKFIEWILYGFKKNQLNNKFSKKM